MNRRSKNPTRHAIVLTGCALALSSLAPPAQAQYYNGWSNWTYLPYTLGNSLLYPLLYAFRMPYGVSNPQYLAQYAVQGATRGLIYRAPGYGPSPLATQPYTDPEPLDDPRQRQRPYRVGNNQDMNSYANWKQPPQSDNDPPIDPATGNLISQPPPLAPQRGVQPGLQPGSAAAMAAEATPPAMAQGAAPLAAGFINNVNSKFDGDISKALFNSETRSWARIIGLADNNDIFNAELSNDRVEVIRKIFKDPTLDPLSKIDATKILLRSASTHVAKAK